MAVFRVDWNYIKSHFPAYGEWDFLIIPRGGRHILSSLVGDRLEWEATFDTGGYDFADWDELQQIATATHQGLYNAMSLNDFLGKMDALIAAIEAANRLQQNQVCCDAINYVPMPDDGIIIDDGTPPATYGGDPVADWDEWKTYLCGATDLFIDKLIELLEQIDEAINNGLFAVAGVAVLLGILALPQLGILIAIDFVAASAMFGALVDFATGSLIQGAIADIELNRDTLRNAIFCSSDSTQAEVALRAELENVVGAPTWSVIKWLNYTDMMRSLFSGVNAAGDPLGVVPATDCSCVAPILPTYNFTNDYEGWYVESTGTAPGTIYNWESTGGRTDAGCVYTYFAWLEASRWVRYALDVESLGVAASAGTSFSYWSKVGGSSSPNYSLLRITSYIVYSDDTIDSLTHPAMSTSYGQVSFAPTAGNYGKTIKRIMIRHYLGDGYGGTNWIRTDDVQLTGFGV